MWGKDISDADEKNRDLFGIPNFTTIPHMFQKVKDRKKKKNLGLI